MRSITRRNRHATSRINRWLLLIGLVASQSIWAQAETLLITTEHRWPQISPDGQFVVWLCESTNNWCVNDLETGATQEYLLPGGFDYRFDTGADFRFFSVSNGAEVIAFSAFIAGVQPTRQIFLFHRLSNTVEQITLSPGGADGDGYSDEPIITPDGRYIAFGSTAGNLHLNDDNDVADIYRYDRLTATLNWITPTSVEGIGNTGNDHALDISDDGQVIAFITVDPLVPNDLNESGDAYVWNDGTLARASVSTGGNEVYDPDVYSIALSGDGNIVIFTSDDDTGVLDSRKTSDRYQLFMRDRTVGTTEMISDNMADQEPICTTLSGSTVDCVNDRQLLAINFDGNAIVYSSRADGLVSVPHNEFGDLYVYNRSTGVNELVSYDETGAIIESGSVSDSFISIDGVKISFDDVGGTYVRDRGDVFPPVVSVVRTDPDSPEAGETVTLRARVSDNDSGGARIASAEYTFNGGGWEPMEASDGAFDTVSEDVEADVAIALSSEHEFCVRGTDAVGWTSQPECISIVVAEASVGLRVRCLHSPIYPQEGDLITVTAQALDREGVPVIAGEVEIYINDTQTPVQSVSGTDAEIAANRLSDGEDIFYGCRASRGTEDAFSRYVTVDIGDPLIPGFPAIPVIFHGAMSESIDLVFLPEIDSYPEGALSEAFQEDIYEIVREGLFEIPWFVRWQYVINVWIAKEGTDVFPRALPGQDPLCAAVKPPGYGKRYSFGDAVGVIHAEDCRDVAIPLWPFTTRFGEGDEHNLQVVAHEIGHKAFSLADEYVTSPTVRFSTPPNPNLFPTLANCRFAAEERDKNPDECRELPGGLLNLNGRFIFEPDYLNEDDPESEVRDLMQQTGNGPCSFDDSETCQRYQIGDSEEARVFWKLSKCIGGDC